MEEDFTPEDIEQIKAIIASGKDAARATEGPTFGQRVGMALTDAVGGSFNQAVQKVNAPPMDSEALRSSLMGDLRGVSDSIMSGAEALVPGAAKGLHESVGLPMPEKARQPAVQQKPAYKVGETRQLADGRVIVRQANGQWVAK